MLHSPVLVGTNLTPGAEGALRQAAGLARDLGMDALVGPCRVEGGGEPLRLARRHEDPGRADQLWQRPDR